MYICPRYYIYSSGTCHCLMWLALAKLFAIHPYLMSKEDINMIEYIVSCIGAFAQRFAMTNRQAYQYLHQYQGLQFLMDYYDIEHTQSIDDAVEDCASICQRHGGTLVFDDVETDSKQRQLLTIAKYAQ